jgi:hypothetical protein
MEPGGSMSHSLGLSNTNLSRINPLLVLIPIALRSILILSSHRHLGLPRGLFPVGLTNSMAYETRRSKIAFKGALQQSLSRAESTQFLVLIPIDIDATNGRDHGNFIF